MPNSLSPPGAPHVTLKFGVVSALPEAHGLKVEARIPVPKKVSKCSRKNVLENEY